MTTSNATRQEANTTRIAMITGASRGFGLATARSLRENGWSLILDGRDPDALGRAVAQLGGGVHVEAIAGDVADPVHRAQMVATASAMGGLDLLVNNASLLGPSPQPRLAEYPLDVLRRVYEVNVISPLALVQATLPLLRERTGTIVNVTSDAAVEGYAGWGGYGSSKAALNQISNVLAAEETGVTVVWFDPGDMNTAMHQDAFPGEDISDRPPPEDSVPSLLRLVDERRPSGSYRVEQPAEAT